MSKSETTEVNLDGWLTRKGAAAMLGVTEKHVDSWWRTRLDKSTDERVVSRQVYLRGAALVALVVEKETAKLQERLSMNDPELAALMGGADSDWLEKCREQTAIKLELSNAKTRGELIEVAVLRVAFREGGNVMRASVETMQKHVGPEVIDVYTEALESFERAVAAVLVEASGEVELERE